MERRLFLKLLAAATTTAAASTHAAPWRRSLTEHDRILLSAVTPEQSPQPMTLYGSWPEDLTGVLYRNGPALFARDNYRHPHWFDGDGMIQRFELNGKGVTHSSRYVRTHKFVAEEAVGRFLYSGTLAALPDALPLRHNDSVNTANINVQKIGGKLMALWEAGSAYELHPDSLETQAIQTLGDDLEHLPFSAHPMQDINGHWWNIGSWVFGEKAQLLIYRLNAAGKLRQHKALTLDQKGYIHAFAMSERYLVVLNSACIYTPAEQFIRGFNFDERDQSQILLIDKNTLEIAKTVDIPANFAFHFGTSHEEQGSLHVSMAEYRNADIMLKGMRHGTPSFGRQGYPSTLVHYTINVATGAVERNDTGIEIEFPQYRLDQPYQRQALFGIGRTNGRYPGFSNSLLATSPDGSKAEHFHYGSETIAEEPLLVRSRSNQHYLLQPWLDLNTQRSGLSLFNPNRITQGPIATAMLGYAVPPGFHGCFTA